MNVSKSLGTNDLIWAYVAQFFRVGAGLIMLPIIMHYMSAEEVGLWFVFVTLAGLVQLLEFGFQPTLARNVAYVYAGAQELTAFGVSQNTPSSLNQELLADLVCSTRWIYSRISLLVILALWGGGTLYIMSVLPDNLNESDVIPGWLAYSIGFTINFYYAYLTALLQGRGDITVGNKITVVSQLFAVALGSVLIIMGWGLLGLGLAFLISAFVGRVMANYYVYSSRDEMKNLISSNERRKDVVGILWYNSWRFGLVMLGVFLIWRANILIAASYLGVVEAASYALAIQVLFLLHSIATVPFQTSLPSLNALRSQNENDLLYQKFSQLLTFGLLIQFLGSLIIVLYGNELLNLLGSNTFLPDSYVLFAMSVVFMLEINHGTCANFITVGNSVPFVAAALWTGVGIVLLSYLWAPIYGVIGLVAAQAIVQLVYNNWKWPLVVSKSFAVTYVGLISYGISLLVKRGYNLLRGNVK